MKKILVPCDFSTPAQEAFRFAVDIALQSKGEIFVFHIIDITFLRGNASLAHSYAFNLNFLKEMEKEADEKFRAMWKKYSPLTLPVRFIHRVGSLVTDITNFIKEKEIDLVVMGTRGAGSESSGSNAEKIVRNSPVPVISIRKSPAKGIKSILVPVIPNEPDKGLAAEIKKIQAFFGAQVHLLWINTPRLFKTDSEATADLHQYAIDFKIPDYTVTIRSDYNVEDGIQRFSEECHADMIAMGTHAWKGLTRSFAGSTAENIVNHVSLPVWTYPMRQSGKVQHV